MDSFFRRLSRNGRGAGCADDPLPCFAGKHRLRKPGADVLLAHRPCRLEAVEAEARNHRGQEGPRANPPVPLVMSVPPSLASAAW